MAKLNDETHVLMDGSVKVYRRPNTRRWQATFQIGGVWVRISTGQKDLEDAKRVARDQYLDYKFREKHGLPVVTKRFEDVANLAIHKSPAAANAAVTSIAAGQLFDAEG